MGMTWTTEQRKVIDLRGRNILVSAAAGSGKTAVLVERILSMVTDSHKPLDVDRLLIVTFTRAAAGEMRERLRGAIEKRLAQEPDNHHLQRQSTLVYSAQISTIDGFCGNVIRNYFHRLDLDPAYRIGEEGELKLLRADAAQEVMEAAYAKGAPDFYQLVECYATGKTDEGIVELMLKVYEFAMSYPWPLQTLDQWQKIYQVQTEEELRESPWMQALMDDAEKKVQAALELAREANELAQEPGGPYMYAPALEQDVQMLEKLEHIQKFDEYVQILSELSFAALPRKKDDQVDSRIREQVKGIRDQVKEMLKSLRENYFSGKLEEVLKQMQVCQVPVCALIHLARDFMEEYGKRKREKNLLDFSDLEHFALDILVEQENGEIRYTSAARELSEQFEEILIDEYQDSSFVQEQLMLAVSKVWQGKHNIFMVGDVKQSIYRFRLARPELFMEKFDVYTLEDGQQQRIDLHKNFRSRAQVLEGINYLFYQIMGREMGDVEYDSQAALYPGAQFPEGGPEASVEVLLAEADGPELEEEKGTRMQRELEALAIARKIQEMAGVRQVLDKDTKKYRPCRYGDMVILLRTASGWSDVFVKVLKSRGIPAYSVSKTGYFSALEVVAVLNYLRICNNPRQDIPLAAVLHSPIGGCTAQEMALLGSQPGSLYERAREYAGEGEDNVLREKLVSFFDCLDEVRHRVAYTPIHQLLLYILKVTGYGSYAAALPPGEQRAANLQMLVEKAREYEASSYRGLFHFVRYVENLQKYQVDYGEVPLAGAEEHTVRIMTIHKSKGLEFPIVFAAGMGKRFNQQDANARLLLHPDLGIGTDAVFPEERICTRTVIRQVLHQKTLTENLGEELRVLYVAMTRAKEKLILTGTITKLEKHLLEYQRLWRRREVKLPVYLLEKARDYWGWILPALARHPAAAAMYEAQGLVWEGDPSVGKTPAQFTVEVTGAGSLLESEVERQAEGVIHKEMLLSEKEEEVYHTPTRELLQERFSFVYPYANRVEIPVKVSVSEIREQEEREDDSEEMYFEPDVVPLIPDFMEEREEGLQGAARGTIYHKALECLDFAGAETKEGVQKQLDTLVSEGRLDETSRGYIRDRDLLALARSPLGKRMKLAQRQGMLYREQPFVISRKASEVNEGWNGEEQVLVQGIVDAYFLEQDEIVVVDYKTNWTPPGGEQCLADQYRVQLECYGQALERLTGKRVKEKYLYSFCLGKAIEI